MKLTEAIRKNLITQKQAEELIQAKKLKLLLSDNGIRALEQGLITVEQVERMPYYRYLVHLFSNNGLIALRRGWVTAETVANIQRSEKVKYLLSDNGLIALSQGWVTADQCERMPFYRHLVHLFSENGLVALSKGWVTVEQVLTIQRSENVRNLFSIEGLVAFTEGWISLEKIREMPVVEKKGQEHLQLLFSLRGLLALSLNLIAPEQAIQMSHKDLNAALSYSELLKLAQEKLSQEPDKDQDVIQNKLGEITKLISDRFTTIKDLSKSYFIDFQKIKLEEENARIVQAFQSKAALKKSKAKITRKKKLTQSREQYPQATTATTATTATASNTQDDSTATSQANRLKKSHKRAVEKSASQVTEVRESDKQRLSSQEELSNSAKQELVKACEKYASPEKKKSKKGKKKPKGKKSSNSPIDTLVNVVLKRIKTNSPMNVLSFIVEKLETLAKPNKKVQAFYERILSRDDAQLSVELFKEILLHFFNLAQDKEWDVEVLCNIFNKIPLKTELIESYLEQSSLQIAQCIKKGDDGRFSKHTPSPQSSAVQASQKVGFFRQEHRNQSLPSWSEAFSRGRASDNGDCFFDALAQRLNTLTEVDKHTIKSLRTECFNYYQENKREVGDWNHNDSTQIEQGDLYMTIQYTANEHTELFDNGAVLWGRPKYEGTMLCRQLGLEAIYIIDIHGGDVGVTFQKITQEGEHVATEQEVIENSSNAPCLVCERSHFSPLLPKIMSHEPSASTATSQQASR